MSFHLLVAYGMAAVAIAVLALMGMRNRQSGWRRERNDNIVDALIAWAEKKADARKASNTSMPGSIASDLSALSGAVGTDATKPATQPEGVIR
jgi:hypothetical protein